MKIFVTGGAGFIGSHLSERLLADKHEVFVIDDLSTGCLENIAALKVNKNFHFFEGTIMDYRLLLKVVTSCDCIYHLAAAVGVKYIIENPLNSLLTNVRGTEIVLEQANIFHRKVFIASSSEIYGKNSSRPLAETDDRILGNVTVSRWGYACSKSVDEFLALAYYKSKNLPIVIGRLFNICGPRQSANYGMVIPRFIQQALRDEPITVYGDGQQVRSFTYIDDAVSAITRVMNEPKAEGEIFNIGSSEYVTINDLARKIKQLSGSRSEIIHIPYKQAYAENFEDMLYRVPDISKLTALTGVTPKLKLDEMLKIIINEHRERLFGGLQNKH